MKKTKKEVKVDVPYYIDADTFSGDLTNVIKELESLPDKIREQNPRNNDIQQAHRFSIINEREWDFDEYRLVFYVVGYRWETEEEANERIKQARQRKIKAKEAAQKALEAKKQNDRELYETLKKIFEV